MEIKTITIIGQGALGILFGSQLAKHLGNQNVRFLADRERIDRYQKEGIFCNGKKCDFTYITPDMQGNPADLLIFAVKYPALPQAIRDAKNQVGDKTIILSLMNGITSEQLIGDTYGMDHMLYCVAQGMDATRTGNQLVYSTTGLLEFGEIDNTLSEKVKAVETLFKKADIQYHIPEDMNRIMWKKFMLNVGVNQVTAAFNSDYGAVQAEGEQRDTMIAAMREVIQIANRKGIHLTEEDIQYWLNVLDGFKPELMPSMRQDTAAKRKTEVELFSGAMIRMGKELDVPVPVNEMLYKKIREIESAYGPGIK